MGIRLHRTKVVAAATAVVSAAALALVAAAPADAATAVKTVRVRMSDSSITFIGGGATTSGGVTTLHAGRYQFHVVARPQMPRPLAHRHRAEPGPRPVGDAVVERDAEDRHVVVGDPVDLGQPGERASAREPRHLPPVDRPDRFARALRHGNLPFA